MEKQVAGSDAGGSVLELKRMKHQFVADGERRLEEGLRQNAGPQPHDGRAQGGVLKRLSRYLVFLVRPERSKSSGHRPSPGTLW
jgi:hypothetical protein